MSSAAEEAQYELEVGDAVETEVEVETAGEENFHEESAPQEKDELENYSESVQKRINRLTKKMRDSERQRDEAIRYAQNVQNESNQIRQRMQNLDQGYMSEYGSRLSLQQQQAEANLKRAVELGDADAQLQAQKELSQLAIASNNYAQAQKQAQRYAQEQQYYAQMAAQQRSQQPAKQQAQGPDPKAEKWAQKNAWFGQDEAMTFAAFGIHKKLIEDEGFDPQSNEYYNELDSRIRREFPHKFGANSSASRRPAQNVAGVSRSSSTSGRTGKRVKLSPTQVAIAKKLGVPLEEYAKYVKE